MYIIFTCSVFYAFDYRSENISNTEEVEKSCDKENKKTGKSRKTKEKEGLVNIVNASKY